MSKNIVRYTLAFAVAAVALWFAFRDTDFDKLGAAIASANLLWILLGVTMQFLSHLLRAWRWHLFLMPVKQNVKLWNSFKALIAGYGTNNLIPRSGEIVRPVIFARREHVPIPATVATIVIERISDLFGMVLFGLASMFLFQDKLEAAFPDITRSSNTIFGVTTILLVVCIAIFISETRTAALIRMISRPLPVKFKEKVHRAGQAFAQGLQGIKERAFTSFVLGTLGIWGLYALSMYFSFFAFQDPAIREVGFVGAILMQMLSGIAFIVPTPGGTGSYHAILSAALMKIFNVPEPIALAYVTLTHGFNYISTTIVGLAFMFSEGVNMSKLREEAKAAKDDVPADTVIVESQPAPQRD